MGSAAPIEVTLRLLSVEQLFVPPPPGRMHEAETLVAGMDELMSQLSHRRVRNGVRTTIHLPQSEVTADTDARIRAAVARYCRLRARTSENELKSVRQDGLRALWIGVPLAALALAISAVVYGDDERDAAQVFVGEGLLLVFAWVALWYPIEALLLSLRPYRRQQRLLDAVREMEIVVVADGNAGAQPPGPARQS